MEDNLNLILGFGVGLLVAEMINIFLAAGLAVDISRERAVSKVVKHRKKQQRQAEREQQRQAEREQQRYPGK